MRSTLTTRWTRPRKGFANGKRHLLRLTLEQLEPRQMLAGDPWTWFQSFDDVPRIPAAELAATPSQDQTAIGPHELVAGEWIVQLTEGSARRVHSLDSLNNSLDQSPVDFTVISGLGSPGLALLRGRGVTSEDVEWALASHEDVVSFSRNSIIEGQATPQDPEFAANLLPGLSEINAPAAWDQTIGSSDVVVGVVDGGIDPTHPDLFLNIWLNQGEIPETLRDQLQDIDGDGLITFYDLNNLRRTGSGMVVASTGGAATVDEMTTDTPFAEGVNASLVEDKNGNGRIDAIDLLEDVTWADGRDTDGNSFFDDFFGVNFRAGVSDPFPSNRPLDQLGHGTHVAGTIGAVGDNGFGVVGVNWQTSLMSLRILDNNNQSDAAAAIKAINYAREMRGAIAYDDLGRLQAGANVRVLNNSWGQPGGFDRAFESAIDDLGDQGILFVAASGNGNLLGVGVDNDRTPFYPASYESDNVIAVAALAADGDRLASFSNYGATSVDIAAPGVGVRSTLPGGGFGPANGTSMATPHVAGAAALIWAALPGSTVDEVKQALLETASAIPVGLEVLSTGGRLDAAAAKDADVFAPSATLLPKATVSEAGGDSTEFTVVYRHSDGIDVNTIGDDDLFVARTWGPEEFLPATLKPGSVVLSGNTATATYVMTAPGGTWDPLDYGGYEVRTFAGSVATVSGNEQVKARLAGTFDVRIEDPAVYYVATYRDGVRSASLRNAIMAANDAPGPRTIILESGTYEIESMPASGPYSTFVDTPAGCGLPTTTGWSGEQSGDFDITGKVTIVGDLNDETIIDANGFDRVFKVHAGGSLDLRRVTVTGGVSPADQGGGGILSAGQLTLSDSIVRGNVATSESALDPGRGGGIAAWGGDVAMQRAWIDGNDSNFGGGIFFCGVAGGTILQSTISGNVGGGLHSHSDTDITINNSTFSGNSGGKGAIFNGKRDGIEVSIDGITDISGDGRFAAFDTRDGARIYDIDTDTVDLVSPAIGGSLVNNNASSPRLSGDGRYVTYGSAFPDLVPGDTNGTLDIFLFDRETRHIDRVSVTSDGEQTDNISINPDISDDGRFVSFISQSDNLGLFTLDVPGILVHDNTQGTTEIVKFKTDGVPANWTDGAYSHAFRYAFSPNWRYHVFSSDASNLVANDDNDANDLFVYDMDDGSLSRVTVAGVTSLGVTNNKAAISNDGRFIAFVSDDTTSLRSGGTPSSQIVLVDRGTATAEIVSLGMNDADPDGMSYSPKISTDGRYVGFLSEAANLVPGDTNGAMDAFVYDRIDGSIEIASLEPSGLLGNGVIEGSDPNVGFAFSNSGDKVLFRSSFGVLLRERDTQTTRELLAPTPSVIHVSQVTIAETAEAQYAVDGAVRLTDVLLSRQDLVVNPDTVVLENVIPSSEPGAELISVLAGKGDMPPVHQLLVGNPAIDRGSVGFVGSIDQLGQPRTVPDIGSHEVVSASIRGHVFVDTNHDQLRQSHEPLIADVVIVADSTTSGIVTVSSQRDDPLTRTVDETGSFQFEDLPSGDYAFEVSVPENWSFSQEPLQHVPPITGNASISSGLELSRDGRFLVFADASTNYVAGDSNGYPDIFVYDRHDGTIDMVSVNAAGEQANHVSEAPSISADGRIVAFFSFASNLDAAGKVGLYVFDREERTIDFVSERDGQVLNVNRMPPAISDDGNVVVFRAKTNFGFDSQLYTYERTSQTLTQITDEVAHEKGYSISGDGRFIAFGAYADDIIPGSPFRSGVFVYDRLNNSFEQVDVSSDGIPANDQSGAPYISRDGRYVAFVSEATNLVPGVSDFGIYVRDRNTQSTQYVTDGSGPVISDDGRFVTFSRDLIADLFSPFSDYQVFVFDRQKSTEQMISVNGSGVKANQESFGQSISGDGRIITFISLASNLPDIAQPGEAKAFLTANPLADPGFERSLAAGDFLTQVEIGIVPDDGVIAGRIFEDVIDNGVLDAGEPLLEGWSVFLDFNGDGEASEDEPLSRTGVDGAYSFDDVPSFQNHLIRAVAPVGWQQVAPNSLNDFAWSIYLPPAGSVAGRDFAFRRVTGSGQSSNSSVSGTVADTDGTPIPNVVVYLDSQNFGVRDPNEPATETDQAGNYSIENLGATIAAVSTQLSGELVHVSPLGSDFDLEKTPLFDELRPFANPQAIEVGDFNGDGNPDVAVALAEANAISIRLNDGQGGFLADGIDVELGAQAAGPTSLVIGQFNGDTTNLDVAVVNNFSSNVMILKDFNGSGFDSVDVVDVGSEPIDIASVAIGGDDAFLDLVVVNKADNTVQVLRNNAGTFTAKMAVPTDGNSPVALVAGDFGGGAVFHVAVAHAAPANTTTPLGDVRTFRGDASGNLTLDATRYEVGATPTDLVAANFDGDPDGRIDLAVANFASNSISILTGNADGSFTVQSQTLGTASGAFDIAAADMDNDGDIDLVASNLLDRNISIFRNRSQTPGMTDFEPLEAVGLGQFGVAQRMPLALANFDQDQSAPGGRGTIDIVAIPRQTDTLHVLKNRLVDGAHRVELDGLNAVTGRDFVLKPATLFPTLDPIPDPEAIDEGDGQQRIKLTGLAKGRVGGPELRFEAASDNLDLVADPHVQQVDGQTYLLYTPTPLTSGTAVLSVRVIDAGADGEFDTEGEPFPDDVVVQRSVTVTVLPVNDPPTFSIPAALAAEERGAGAPAVVEPGFATGISVGGGADEAASQTLSDFVLTTDNDAAFSLLPTINAAGQLSFRTADSFAGTVTVVVSLSDNGGTENGGRDTTTQDFVLTILPVNDPPSITIGGNQSVESGSGLRTVPDFATGFLPGGGADGANQTISDFVVSTDSPGLFSVLPDIGLDGTLTFAPAAIADGVAMVTVQVRDSGGTERGGNDLSAEQTFTIAVTGVPDNTPPQPVITSDQPSLTNQNTFEVTIDFGEPVDGFTASDVIADGATVGQPEHLGDGRYVVSITMPTDGALVIDVPAGVATDAAGNANLAAAETLTITIDSSALVPQLTTNEPSLTSNGSFEITIAFGEPVTGFQLSDLTVINATASNLQDQGGGQYVTTITSTNDGQLAVLIPAGAAKDAAGNVSLTSGVLILQVDTVSPAPVLRSLVAGQNHPNSFDVDLDFGEPVAGLTQGDLALSSGSIESLNDLGDGRYLIRLIDLNEGSFTLSLVEGAASDLAGNVSLAAEDFNANVLTINATSIVLEGSGNTFFMNQPDSQLDGIQLIDIRGTGDNTLMLSADRIRDTFTDSQILIVSDTGDEVVFDAGWQFVEAIIDDGRLIRRFSNSGAALNLAGPDDFTNPIDLYDVNASGDVTALDALQVINELGGRVFSDSGSNPSGQIRPIDQINPSDFRFYDVNADHRVSALDALRVINELGRRVITGAGESVVLTSLAAKGDDETADELLDAQIPQPLAPAVKNVAQSAAEQPVPWGSGDGANQTPRDTEELEPELVDAALEGLFHD